jgi:hypothetical protein
MKKAYSVPSLELVQFRFSEHVVASGGRCRYENIYSFDNDEPDGCKGTFLRKDWLDAEW